MKQSEILEILIQRFNEMKSDVSKTFYYSDEESLSIKPSEKRWSALQCFEHMNLTNDYYLKQLSSSLEQDQTDFVDKAYQPSFLKNFMVEGMKPKNGNISNKIKTFKSVKPLAEREIGAIVKSKVVFADFFEDLDRLVLIAEEFKRIDGQRIKVNTLLGPILKMKGIDALRFLLAHNERHLLQAKNALEGF